MTDDSHVAQGHKVVIDSDVIAPRIYLGTKGKPTVVFYRLNNEGIDGSIYVRAFKQILRNARYAGHVDLLLKEIYNITHEELLPIAKRIYGTRFVKHQIKRLIRIHYIDNDGKYEHRPDVMVSISKQVGGDELAAALLAFSNLAKSNIPRNRL